MNKDQRSYLAKRLEEIKRAALEDMPESNWTPKEKYELLASGRAMLKQSLTSRWAGASYIEDFFDFPKKEIDPVLTKRERAINAAYRHALDNIMLGNGGMTVIEEFQKKLGEL